MQGDPVSAVFLLREDGAALMQHRDDKPGLDRAGMWVPPGGHREPWESAEDCARRELEEETAYRCGELELLCTMVEEQQERPPYELSVFRAAYDGQQQLECREGQALDFIPREEADSYAIPLAFTELWDRALAAAEHEVTYASTDGHTGSGRLVRMGPVAATSAKQAER